MLIRNRKYLTPDFQSKTRARYPDKVGYFTVLPQYIYPIYLCGVYYDSRGSIKDVVFLVHPLFGEEILSEEHHLFPKRGRSRITKVRKVTKRTMHPTLDFSHHFRFFNMQYLFLKEIMYSYLSIFPIGFVGEMTRFLFKHFPAETVGTGDPPKSGSGRCGFGALCGLTVFAAQRRSREGQMCLVNVSCHLERNLLELSCCIGLTKISIIHHKNYTRVQ